MIDLEFGSQATPPEKLQARPFRDVGDSVLYRNLSDIAHHVPQEDFWIIQVPFLALAEKAFALCQKAVMKQEWERTVLSS
jgi:hypothetical protein